MNKLLKKLVISMGVAGLGVPGVMFGDVECPPGTYLDGHGYLRPNVSTLKLYNDGSSDTIQNATVTLSQLYPSITADANDDGRYTCTLPNPGESYPSVVSNYKSSTTIYTALSGFIITVTPENGTAVSGSIGINYNFQHPGDPYGILIYPASVCSNYPTSVLSNFTNPPDLKGYGFIPDKDFQYCIVLTDDKQ